MPIHPTKLSTTEEIVPVFQQQQLMPSSPGAKLTASASAAAEEEGKEAWKTKNGPRQADWSFLKEGTLFGRDKEILRLREVLERRQQLIEIGKAPTTTAKKPELLLVSGPSGVGKTALVQRALRLPEVYYCLGKFDQLTTTAEPYAPFVQALTQLAVALEEQQSTKVYHQIERIRDQVGLEYCKVLGSMVPRLARLWKLPSTQTESDISLTLEYAQPDRLPLALSRLFQALCPSPVVLVMDDLQWADPKSLRLVEALTTTGNKNLTVVGICRSNEVPWEHGFAELLRRLEDEHHATIHHVVVPNLTLEDTTRVLSRVLQHHEGGLDRMLPLAERIHQNSNNGNVYHVLQWLKTLLEQGVLVASPEWTWDEDKWREMEETSRGMEDVVRLVSREIQSLPRGCRRLLKKMACLGGKTDTEILAMAFGGGAADDAEEQHPSTSAMEEAHAVVTLPPDQIQKLLGMALQEGLIVELLPHQPGCYAFQHDRVQQAAYGLVPEAGRPKEHLLIGRALLQHLTPDDLDRHLFLVVNQLIAGIGLLTNEADKIGVSELCVRAGKKATKCADFDTARAYLDVAKSLLPSRYWRDEYHLSLELFCARAQAECLANDRGAMEDTIEEVLTHARSPKDAIPANMTRLYSLGNNGSDMRPAMDLGFRMLKGLGQRFPQKPRVVYLVPELLKVQGRLRSVSDDDIYNLPILDPYDAQKTANVVSVLAQIMPYSFLGAPDYFPFVVLRALELTLKHGLCPISCTSLSAYGLILCALGDYVNGNRYAHLGLRLLDRFPRARAQVLPKISCYCYGLVFAWEIPIAETFEPMDRAVQLALDVGDFETAMYTSYTMLTNSFAAGSKLSLFEHRVDQCLRLCSDDSPWRALAKLAKQHVHNLTGRSVDPLHFDVHMDVATNIKQNFDLYRFSASSIRMMLAYHLKRIDLAMACAKAARKLAHMAKASLYINVLYLYDGLIALEAARSCKNGIQRQRLVALARGCYKKLSSLAKIYPENILHKALLLEGELAAYKGKLDKAIQCFEESVGNSRERGQLQFLALAHERAASALERQGRTPDHAQQAALFLDKAVDAYSQWGAITYVHFLGGIKG